MLGWDVVRGVIHGFVGVRGCHGVGRVNDNGEALLSWYDQNGLAVMNVSEEEDTPVHMAAPMKQTVALH